ncbi:MAG TPA: hypothetical protein DCY86_00030 [Bdellovibrionales bacterium]|nr:hypothetical protein [Bdellovibrionales bacterium]
MVTNNPNPLKHLANILVVVGPTCAGKTTFAKYIGDHFGFTFIEVSNVLRNYPSDSTENFDLFKRARFLEKNHGIDFLAKKILELYDFKNGSYVISGFRLPQEFDLIRQHIPKTIMIFVDSMESQRFNRSLERHRSDMTQNIEAFRMLDQAQASLGLLELARHKADISLENNGTLTALFRSICGVMPTLANLWPDK